MSMYLNPGNNGFADIRRGRYVDKTKMIDVVNSAIGTKGKMICVSRPRRFGKSFAAQMLCAYYDRDVNSHKLFDDMNIAKSQSYNEFINKYDVIYVDMAGFISRLSDTENYINEFKNALTSEIKEKYNDITEADFTDVLLKAAEITGRRFVFIIDEWDAIFREAKDDSKLQEEYVRFLRGLFKDSAVTDRIVEVCYMTGILPIKKYGTQSALTDFNEYTMINPGPFAEYFGFTEGETKKLCDDSGLSFSEVEKWYDGYELNDDIRIFNPKSVMDCVNRRRVDNYWTESETFESLKIYIDMDLDGLREALVQMLGGSSVPIDTGTFQNDMTSVKSRDDVLTLLIHLGYLSYSDGYVRIPNEEIRREFLRAIKADSHSEITKLVKKSDKLLIDTINGDEEAVASAMEEIHNNGTAILQYNDEQALRSVVKFAYISCVNEYAMVEELPSGKGFADLVYIPKKTSALPALLIELKWNKSAESAIAQIKENHYPDVLKNLSCDLVLVGINYDPVSKKHTCKIEKSY